MLSIRHVDTCLPDYVLDHCNGETEALVGIPVYGSTTYARMRSDLLADIHLSCDKLPEEFGLAEITAAVDELFETVPDMAKAFAPMLEPSDEDCHSTFAWFRLNWGDE